MLRFGIFNDPEQSAVTKINRPNGYWTPHTLQTEALKYTTRTEFKEGARGAYKAADRQKLLDAICSHMNEGQKPHGYWTLETLQVEALKYTTRSEFQRGNGSAYGAAGRMNLRDAICGHMTEVKKPDGYWTLERLRDEALKYSSRQEFQKLNGAAYKAAGLMKRRDEICAHMLKIKHPKGHWTLENLKLEALKYDNKVDFRKHSNPAFLTASRQNVLEQICGHMTAGKLPNGHWLVKENCAKEALRYTNRRAFSLGNSSAYHGADSNGWLEEICGHMDFNPSSDGDVVYIWRALGHEFNNRQVYKIGTTSERLGDRRIKEVARWANMEVDIVILAKVKTHASQIEMKLLELGVNPKYEGFNGSSEFRALTNDELDAALSLIGLEQESVI